MLNTNIKLGSNSQNVTFNQTSTGMMQRSNPNSIFVRFQRGSPMEKMVFPSNGTNSQIAKFEYGSYRYEEYKKTEGRIDVTVLQILIFGEDQYLCEVIENKFIQSTSQTEL